MEPGTLTGKDALGDLYEGKRSLPIIHLLATSSDPDGVVGMERVMRSTAPPTVCGPCAMALGPLMTRTCDMRVMMGK